MKPRIFKQAPSGCARATSEHMPFAGHQTVATMWAKQAGAKKRDREKCSRTQQAYEARQFGFEAESLKASER